MLVAVAFIELRFFWLERRISVQAIERNARKVL